MLSQEVNEYSKLLNINLEEKLKPINETVDQMIIRLEELENMIAIVQQERCNAIGLTGSLTDVVHKKDELLDLCKRIDSLEKLIEHITNNINHLENKIVQAEEQIGLKDNTTKLKNLLSPLFKKGPDVKEPTQETRELFSSSDYFKTEPGSNP